MALRTHSWAELAVSADDLLIRRVTWFTRWLARQKHYSSQPYEQLASVFEKTGRKDEARDIRYAARERERRGAIEPIDCG